MGMASTMRMGKRVLHKEDLQVEGQTWYERQGVFRLKCQWTQWAEKVKRDHLLMAPLFKQT
jgi:hypothetical protein